MINNRKRIFVGITIVLFSLLFLFVYLVFLNGDSKLSSEGSEKEKISKLYINNTSKFDSIVKYVEGLEGNFSVETSPNGFVIQLNNENIDINDSEVKNAINYLMEQLEIWRIYEDKDSISFVKEADVWEKGILYSKNGEKFTFPKGECDQLKDKWYYYEFAHE